MKSSQQFNLFQRLFSCSFQKHKGKISFMLAQSLLPHKRAEVHGSKNLFKYTGMSQQAFLQRCSFFSSFEPLYDETFPKFNQFDYRRRCMESPFEQFFLSLLSASIAFQKINLILVIELEIFIFSFGSVAWICENILFWIINIEKGSSPIQCNSKEMELDDWR